MSSGSGMIFSALLVSWWLASASYSPLYLPMQSKPSTFRRDDIRLIFLLHYLKKDASTGMIRGPHTRFNRDEIVHNLLKFRVNIIQEMEIFVYTRHTIMRALIERSLQRQSEAAASVEYVVHRHHLSNNVTFEL